MTRGLAYTTVVASLAVLLMLGCVACGSSSSRNGSELSAPTRIAAGDTSCALLSGGSVACWGSNYYGELGVGNSSGPDCFGTCSENPRRVKGISDATQLSVGGSTSCALVPDGNVECWGFNEQGELGDGRLTGPELCHTSACSTSPVRVLGLGRAREVAVGAASACALVSGGRVKCWGDNSFGELGDGVHGGTACEGQCDVVPVQVKNLSDAVQVSVGEDDACALLSRGAVDCWGWNDDGQLGDGKTGGAGCLGECALLPQRVSGLGGAKAVAVGDDLACALLRSGGVDCWGGGSLGNGAAHGPACDGNCDPLPVRVSDITRARQISAGGADSPCVLLSGGRIACWGLRNSGEAGGRTPRVVYAPNSDSGNAPAVQIASSSAGVCALLATNMVVCSGMDVAGNIRGAAAMYEFRRESMAGLG